MTIPMANHVEPSAKTQHYEAKSSGYHSSSDRDRRILELVGGPGLRVLDAACGPGHVGAVMRGAGNRVVCAELSASAAAEARKVLEEVHVLDLEEPWVPVLGAETFDVVFLGEVLEHVFDPVQVLSEARKVLVPGGRVVITTPNFMVWIARLQILFGRFRYQKYGLFDFGHIRWFTYKYLKQVLDESGFALEEERHMSHPKQLDRVVGRWPSLLALYFLVSARKTASSAGGVRREL